MRVHVVSDVHGRADALARAGDGADALICLGDLILFMDYDDHAAGIMGTLFGAEAVGTYIKLRTQGDFAGARELSAGLWATLGNPRAVIEEQVHQQYEQLFAAFPDPTYLTYGNVDLPRLFGRHLRAGVHLLDGEAIELGGVRIGFIGGGLRSPMRTPTELSDEDYAGKLAAIGSVDVLCSHIPPDIPDLLWDTEARRHERGSEALRLTIEQTQPAWALFGHVHQPLLAQTTIGRTRCVNVGHFRARRQPYVLDI